MIIESIQLENFRQFRGKTPRISFAAGPGPRITVIHGEMGHGKTTLLNAFRWVLHGSGGVSDRFQDPHLIVNRHVKEADVNAKASVELKFTQQGLIEGDKSVTVTRWVSGSDEPEAGSVKTIPTSLRVTISTQDPGEPIKNLESVEAQNYINAVIPEGILDILFFDGEGIDKLATANQNKKMAEAVCNLLGFSVVERAIADLKHPDVLGALESQRNSSAGAELAEKYKEYRQHEDLLETLKAKEMVLKSNLDKLAEEEAGLRSKLEKFAAAKDIERRRSVVEAELKGARESHKKEERELALFIVRRGFALVSERLVKCGLTLESKLRDEHKFPAPMMSEYVKQLLSEKKCICGRHLDVGSDPARCVNEILSLARDRDFHDAATSVGRTLSEMNSNLLADRRELERRRDDCIRLTSEITRHSDEIKYLGEELLKLAPPDVKAVELELADCLRNSGSVKSEVNLLVSLDIPAQNKALESLKTVIQRLESSRQVDAEIAAKVALVRDTITFLESSLASASEEVAHLLAEKVNERFAKLIDIPSRAVVRRERARAGYADRFHVDIHAMAADGSYHPETGVNTGKRQCLSLAFISSLIEFASERGSLKATLGSMLPGESYPVVMDAPFSVIDEMAATRVARLLPEYANQVVCLLNTSNYSAPISAYLDKTEYTGKRYVIVHHHPKGSNSNKRTLRIRGRDVAATDDESDAGYEWAEIKDISTI